MNQAAEAVGLDPKRTNALYHDAVASGYDEKWAISFDRRSQRYVRERAARMLPEPRYGRVLDIGAGTGFLVLNLWQAGFVGEAHAIDISTGMLAVLVENARRIGCNVQVRAGDAERLPYPDESFDLIVGHAVLHHLPDIASALREAHRVLAPRGALFIAGEPTRRGDRRAKIVGRLTHRAVQVAARAVPRLRTLPPGAELSDQERIARELEWDVDLHTFDPNEIQAEVRRLGFRSVRVETEELIASVCGWAVRTFESMVPKQLLGRRWACFAYRSWLALSAIDRTLYGVVPKDRFYNLMVYGEKEG